MKLLPPKEYYASLPKKIIGAGVVFLNKKGEMLVLKPNYKKGWNVPGGTVESDESPRDAAVRETKEEIGLRVSDPPLLCVHHVKSRGEKPEMIQFIFFGGTLADEAIENIVLQTDELDEFRFVSPKEAIPLLSEGLQKRVPAALEAMKNGGVVYVES